MTDADMTSQVQAEIDRINKIIGRASLSDSQVEMMAPIIDNVAWMAVKLADARTVIKTAQIAIPYNNGGGQKGIRENPLFRGYEALWKSYMLGMSKIIDALPSEVAVNVLDQTQTDSPKSVLSLVRSKHDRVS